MRSPGPLCAKCGCYRDEHRTHVGEDFHLEDAECLTCGQCEKFEAAEPELEQEQGATA